MNNFSKLLDNPDSILNFSKSKDVDSKKFTDWRWQMSHQLRDGNDFLKADLASEQSKKEIDSTLDMFQSGVTPYYASLISKFKNIKNLHSQVIPQNLELSDNLGQMDPLREIENTPVKEVVHLYPDRVAFCVAQICPVYCRYCYRKRRDDEQGLHFNKNIIARGLEYIKSQPGIKDVLITGGDPLCASDKTLENLISKLRDIPHVEIIRIGTRNPVALPYRLTEDLGKMLSQFHPIWVHTHFNNYREITPDAKLGLDNLLKFGIPINNQSVLLKDVNDSVDEMKKLCFELIKARVRPYYLFHPHFVAGTKHLRVPFSKGIEIMKGLRGSLSGMAIPNYIVDTPHGKIPVQPNYILDETSKDIIFETPRGEIWREKNIISENTP